jgi:energy-coupling factor transport system ATP-binding protein
MIEFKNVSFKYGEQTTLDNISFTIHPGEFVALIGANGAGKTTLSKLFNGLIKSTSGSVTIDGKDTRSTRTSTFARSIGFLFQNPDRQICQNTIREEILFGLKNVVSDPDIRERSCQNILAEFGFDGNKNPFSLSRGERQRVALASLLALKPQVLILDEPTTGLDYRECMHIMGIIEEQNRQGATVVMVSHDMEIVQDFARRVLVINRGKLLGDGPTRNILANRELLKAASLLPPQIAALALELGGNFRDIFTVEEMVQVLEGGCCIERIS